MRELLHTIEEALKNSANYLPLELSSFLGGMIEEIIAPIPSPFVMAAVGSAAYAQSKGIVYMLWLAVLGSLGKTIGSWVIYVVADKLEDVVIKKLGPFIGVSHEEVESIGKHLKGGWKDLLILFTLRALPIVPSSPVSAVCGIIKTDFKVYILATFLGNIPRNMIYIYLGFAGVSAYESVLRGMSSAESIMQVVIFGAVAAFVGWIYYKRHKRAGK